MTTSTSTLDHLPGLAWTENGQSALSGPLLALTEGLDRAFLRLAGAWQATDYRFPAFISAAELHRVDYFRSFPHLATFPVCLEDDDANLGRFAEGDVVGPSGELRFSALRPVRDVLTPAACYHFYPHFQGDELDRARHVTTRNTCFRRESYYLPLQRQWAFTMREIVTIGTLDEVRSFLRTTQAMVDRFFAEVGIDISWETATDPFFRPSANAMHLAQRLNPTKQEAIFGGHLAIASVNLHQDHFGATFDITRDGVEATSGCVAFGLERWLFAIVDTFGFDPHGWPDAATLDAASAAAIASSPAP